MATNPQVAQGTLNRLRGSLLITDFPTLNVTAPFLGEAGINLRFEGNSTVFINTMTGAITSQEPFLLITVTVALLRTQQLAELYKRQWEANSQLGEIVIRSDSKAMSPWQATNCAIQNVGEMAFNGRDAGYGVSIQGTYAINNDLWNL